MPSGTIEVSLGGVRTLCLADGEVVEVFRRDLEQRLHYREGLIRGYTRSMDERCFPRPAFTADVVAVVLEDVPRVLLVRRAREPFAGRWALPGGFVDEGERPEDAARRELLEETGIGFSGPLHLVGVYGDPGRDPRGWTVSAAYLAVLDEALPASGGDDAADAAWFTVDRLPTLAFDHDVIVRDALERAARLTG